MVTLKVDNFGVHRDRAVERFTWRSSSGLSVSVISYGAIIQSIKYPDSNGVINDVVLGFDDLNNYVNGNVAYFGATVGRCANRIAHGNFEIEGVRYTIAKNVGNDHLHGGIVGFDKVIWESTVVGTKVIFSYLSKDGEEGYPGDLVTSVSYELSPDDRLHVEFTSTTTKKTVVNLTNHSYFNLGGHDCGAAGLYDHVLSINADKITITDSDSIPTGGFLDVGGTVFDLRTPTALTGLLRDNLFDDNFCITNFKAEDLNFVSRVVHPPSGRYLEVYSNQPGVQLYTSNGLPKPSETALVGKGGVGYRRHQAFCLETQKYPDAVHHTNFPSTILIPGEVYKHKVEYRFGAEKSSNPFVTPS